MCKRRKFLAAQDRNFTICFLVQEKRAWLIETTFGFYILPNLSLFHCWCIVVYFMSCKNIVHCLTISPSPGTKNGAAATISSGIDHGDGCYIQVLKRPNSMEMSTLTLTTSAKVDRPRSNTSESKLMAKRRVIRMLIVIVSMFFICWMPLYSVNTWKAFHPPSAHRALSGAPISFIHLLSYTSACVNPIIYCFMNKRFRKALLTTFSCCCQSCRPRSFNEGDEDVTATGASVSKFNYTTISTMGPCWFPTKERGGLILWCYIRWMETGMEKVQWMIVGLDWLLGLGLLGNALPHEEWT